VPKPEASSVAAIKQGPQNLKNKNTNFVKLSPKVLRRRASAASDTFESCACDAALF